MPLEMGMALYHALDTQRREHRCLFLVPDPHDFRIFASDLAGLDPRCHHNDESTLVGEMTDWLRRVAPPAIINSTPTVEVKSQYTVFIERLALVRGGGKDGAPTYEETKEVMYQLCAEHGWWDWRATRAGKLEFPSIALAWRER